MLHDRQRFSGQRCLLNRQPVRFDEPRVGGHLTARIQLDAIADDDLPRGDDAGQAVAHDTRLRCGEPPERGERLLGPLFLEEADRAVDHDDGQNRRSVGPLAKEPGDHGSDHENHDHELLELPCEPPPPRVSRLRLDLIRARSDEPSRRLRLGQTAVGIGPQACGRRRHIEGVPGLARSLL